MKLLACFPMSRICCWGMYIGRNFNSSIGLSLVSRLLPGTTSSQGCSFTIDCNVDFAKLCERLLAFHHCVPSQVCAFSIKLSHEKTPSHHTFLCHGGLHPLLSTSLKIHQKRKNTAKVPYEQKKNINTQLNTLKCCR